MKKLAISLAAVMSALYVQAAAVTWNTGTLYVPNTDGSWSTAGTKAGATGDTGSWSAMVAFYLCNSDGSLGGAFIPSGTGSLSASGVSSMGNMSSKVGNSGDAVFSISTSYYIEATIVYTDATGGTYTWNLDPTKFTTRGNGDTTLNFQNNAQWASGSAPFSTDVSYTYNAPEPTSGLLVVLGLGLMAIKRKRA